VGKIKMSLEKIETAKKPVKRKNRLLHDDSGIIFVGVVAITFIVLSSITWLACALVVNRVFDGFLPILLTCDPRALATSQSALNAFGVSIVITDVMFLVWWGLSAQKVESQEYAGGVM
jgi:succinate dehydrogenase/fumarate reductase cytochrome b subunit